MSLQLVSLFAGVGGFDIAAKRVGIDPVVAWIFNRLVLSEEAK